MPSIFKNTRFPCRARSFGTGPLLVAWVICGLLAMTVPAMIKSGKTKSFNKSMYAYNYNRNGGQYQQYQQQQWNGERRGSWDLNGCKWYQLGCSSMMVQEDGQIAQSMYVPSWYSGWGTTETQREYQQARGETSASMKFVYAWQLLMFLGILAYGFKTIMHHGDTSGLVGMLLIFANYSWLSMWMLANGSINDGTGEQEEGEGARTQSFFAQFTVLMFMTDFWYFLFGITFSLILGIRSHLSGTEPVRGDESASQKAGDYKAMSEGEGSVGSKNSEEDFVKVI